MKTRIESTHQTIPTTVHVKIHQEEDGSYWAESQDAPGAFTVGSTIEETLTQMKDAIFTHFEVPAEFSDPKRLHLVTTFEAEFQLTV